MKKIIALILIIASVLCILSGCQSEKEDKKSSAEAEVSKPTLSAQEKIKIIMEKKGDYFYGNYEQDGDTSNGKEEIEWIPFAATEDIILMVSKYCLDVRPYVENAYASNLSWENSDLVVWLNNDFFNAAFSDDEKTYMQDIGTGSNPQQFQTKVFILDEQQRSMVPEQFRKSSTTKYAKTIAAMLSNSEPESFWTMPQQLYLGGAVTDVTCWINAEGVADVDYNGEISVPYRGVRPVIAIKIPTESK